MIVDKPDLKKKTIDLSVIIVSYNVRHFLEQCLCSVRSASGKISCELYVVDNKSTDGTCDMVKSLFPEVHLIANNENRGFSAANNQALRVAEGRFILLLNPDTLVEEETFTRCIEFMETHPDAGAAGVKMFNGSGKLLPESKRAFPGPRTAFFKILGLSYLFPKSRLFNNYYLGHLNNDETTKADILTGAFMFLRREAFEKTGFLDEDFFMFGEDIDYCYRLKLKGFNNYYYPKVKIIHFKGESTKKEDLIVIRNFYSAMEIFVRKHFNKGKYQFVTLPIYIAIYFTATLALTKRLLIRVIYQFYDAPPAKKHKTVVVSDHEGYSGVLELVNKSGTSNKITGRISPLKNDTKPHLLGDIDQIREVITTNGIKEVIFTTRGLTYSQLIDCMHQISDLDTKIRIASEHERFLTGNKYVYPSN